MNYAAITHSMSSFDSYILKDGVGVFKLKVEKNDIQEAYLYYVDKYLHGDRRDDFVQRVQMKKISSDHLFDYFEVSISIDNIALLYFFQLYDQEKNLTFFGNGHFSTTIFTDSNYMYHFSVDAKTEDRLATPSWAKDAIVYQIFPDRFHTGEKVLPTNWYDNVSYDTFLGGNLKGILHKLDYLEDLGITAIYLTPIFTSPSNHKYDTTDYYSIDPSFGTKEEFHALITAAHKKNMKIIIDAVFNHSGHEFLHFKDVLQHGENSRFSDWFEVKEFPLQKKGKKGIPTYNTFAYHHQMPKLKTKNPQLSKYLLNIAAYWTQEFAIDGWRLDVADEVSHCFWKEFRKTVREINPEILLVGEIWYDSSEWLRGDEFDTVMNYSFRAPVIELLTEDPKKKIPISGFLDRVHKVRGIYTKQSYEIMWNLIGSHDTPRFITDVSGGIIKENMNYAKLKIAALLQMTFTGVPFIYYGDEVGMQGKHDPDCRRGMLWDVEKINTEVHHYYKTLIALRKNHSSLSHGDFELLYANDHDACFVFRKYDELDEAIIAVNVGTKDILLPKEVLASIDSLAIDAITENDFSGLLPALSGSILLPKH